MPRVSQTPHEEAVSTIEKLVTQKLEGGCLLATASCNQCSEELTLNLVEGVSTVSRGKSVGTVRPDLSLYDNGEVIRFIEVVDSHAPEKNVHEYALKNGIEIVEFHLRAERSFIGKRRNKALDISLTVKARLKELSDGRLLIDAHNLLCQRPKCEECGTPLPLRTVTVSTTDCWNCGQNVNIAVGNKDGEALEQDYFSTEETVFVRENGVTLERRFSATAGGKYLANICVKCDQIQGNFFLYMDPLHDRFNLQVTERQAYGPCDRCAARHCWSHGEYMDYQGSSQCPACVVEAERVMCPHNPQRECFYPSRCADTECYFLNRNRVRQRDREKQLEQRNLIVQELKEEKRKKQEKWDQESRDWATLQEWFDQHKRNN